MGTKLVGNAGIQVKLLVAGRAVIIRWLKVDSVGELYTGATLPITATPITVGRVITVAIRVEVRELFEPGYPVYLRRSVN